jgi:hypothetical protein
MNMTKSKQDIFDDSISPLLAKLVQMCDKHDIPMQFAAQIESANTPKKIVSEALYSKSSNQLFEIVDKLCHGKLNIVSLPDGEYHLTEKESMSHLLVLPFNGIIQ